MMKMHNVEKGKDDSAAFSGHALEGRDLGITSVGAGWDEERMRCPGMMCGLRSHRPEHLSTWHFLGKLLSASLIILCRRSFSS